MRFSTGEHVTQSPEPAPLGTKIDLESARLYEEFAEGRSLDEIYKVWKDPGVTNPTIRQRAVATLTVPNGYELPYPHPIQSIGRLLRITEESDGKTTSSLRERLSTRPELAEELVASVLYWLDTTGGRIEGNLYDPRVEYQTAILQLLPIVGEETADKMFDHYSLKDIKPYQDADSASGYGPLVLLLGDRQIPRKYKEASLAIWLEAAKQEEEGGVQPRTEHERAIRGMAEFVQTSTYDDDVDNEAHTALVVTLEGYMPAGTTYVADYAICRVAEHITDDDVRFRFAWRHMFVGSKENGTHFQIKDERDLTFITWMQREADERGLAEFRPKAEALIWSYDMKRRERAAAHAAELALQARLRS